MLHEKNKNLHEYFTWPSVRTGSDREKPSICGKAIPFAPYSACTRKFANANEMTASSVTRYSSQIKVWGMIIIIELYTNSGGGEGCRGSGTGTLRVNKALVGQAIDHKQCLPPPPPQKKKKKKKKNLCLRRAFRRHCAGVHRDGMDGRNEAVEKVKWFQHTV